MLLHLPSNVLEDVLKYLPVSDLAKFSMVSTFCNYIVTSFCYSAFNKKNSPPQIDPKFLNHFPHLLNNPLFALSLWKHFNSTRNESRHIKDQILCEAECCKGTPHTYLKNYLSKQLWQTEVLLVDECGDRLCCYTSDHTLHLLRDLHGPFVTMIACNTTFSKVPLQAIQVTEQHVIVADELGVLHMLCAETLQLVKTMNYRTVRYYFDSFAQLPTSVAFTTVRKDRVVFACDQINFFGVWNLENDKVETFHGHIMHNERVIKMFALASHFLLISQDRCFNIVIDLFKLTTNNRVKLIGCIGFLAQNINFLIKSIDVQLSFDPTLPGKRRTRLAIQYENELNKSASEVEQ